MNFNRFFIVDAKVGKIVEREEGRGQSNEKGLFRTEGSVIKKKSRFAP